MIAGQARKVGKTSLMTALLRATRWLDWTAVKISTHEGSSLHEGGGAAGSQEVIDRRFALAEEMHASPFTDTGRYLCAGARRAFWLRAQPDGLRDGVAALLNVISTEHNVMIESASVMDVLKPTVSILVLDRRRRAVKPHFRRALTRADAVVENVPSGRRPDRFPPLPSLVQRFVVTRRDWYDKDLGRFVVQKLRRTRDS